MERLWHGQAFDRSMNGSYAGQNPQRLGRERLDAEMAEFEERITVWQGKWSCRSLPLSP